MATLTCEEKAGNVSTSSDKQMEKIYLNPRLLRGCEVSWRVWDMHTIEAQNTEGKESYVKVKQADGKAQYVTAYDYCFDNRLVFPLAGQFVEMHHLEILHIAVYPKNEKLRKEYFSLTDSIGKKIDKYDEIMQLGDNDTKKNEYFKNMIDLLNKSDTMIGAFIKMKEDCFFTVLFEKKGKLCLDTLDNVDEFTKFAQSVKCEPVARASNFEEACKQTNDYIQSQLKLTNLFKNNWGKMKLERVVVCTLIPDVKECRKDKMVYYCRASLLFYNKNAKTSAVCPISFGKLDKNANNIHGSTMVEMKQDDLCGGKLDFVGHALTGYMCGANLTDEAILCAPVFNGMNGDMLELSKNGAQRLESEIMNGVFNSIKLNLCPGLPRGVTFDGDASDLIMKKAFQSMSAQLCGTITTESPKLSYQPSAVDDKHYQKMLDHWEAGTNSGPSAAHALSESVLKGSPIVVVDSEEKGNLAPMKSNFTSDNNNSTAKPQVRSESVVHRGVFCD